MKYRQILILSLLAIVIIGCSLTDDLEECREVMPSYSQKMLEVYDAWGNELYKLDITVSSIMLSLDYTGEQFSYERFWQGLENCCGDGFRNVRLNANDIEPPTCLSEHHKHFLTGMDLLITMFDNIEDGWLPNWESTATEDSLIEMAILGIALEAYTEDSEEFFANLNNMSPEVLAEEARVAVTSAVSGEEASE